MAHPADGIANPATPNGLRGFLVASEELGSLEAWVIGHDEHSVVLEHERETAVLALERRVGLDGAALVAQDFGTSAMDAAGIDNPDLVHRQKFFVIVVKRGFERARNGKQHLQYISGTDRLGMGISY